MKIGMNMLLWTASVNPTHEGLLAFCKEVGFDGVELPLFTTEVADYTPLAPILDGLGLERTAATGMEEEADPIHEDAAVRQEAVNRLKKKIDCCHAIGATVLCGPLHSAFKVFRGRGPTDDEFKRSADVLRECADHAQQAGVLLAPEALNRFECYLLNTSEQMRRLMEMVDHPSVKAHYDTHHMHIEEHSQSEAIKHCAPVLGHVHISENNRGVPGRGQVDWAGSFAALAEVGYDDWAVIESFSRLDPDFAGGIHIWRDYFDDPKEVCTDGYAFVKKMLG